MFKKDKFPFFRQLDYRDCGPTCLRMIAKYHGKNFSREFLRYIEGITRQGVTMAGINRFVPEIINGRNSSEYHP